MSLATLLCASDMCVLPFSVPYALYFRRLIVQPRFSVTTLGAGMGMLLLSSSIDMSPRAIYSTPLLDPSYALDTTDHYTHIHPAYTLITHILLHIHPL